ncbi:DUF1302 family protein [Pseudomonas sp. MPC6]|uniref:DUF1302 domain-containing protein n=1 Tax=unclassified Pseudomonas TaxID=196821 RepID=UPI001375638B|nr:DUF1302 family protein [Pseudomonas sp. MPC6]
MRMHLPFKGLPLAGAILSGTIGLASSGLAGAFELNFSEGSELSGSTDFTLSYATSVRATDADRGSWATAPNFLSDARVPDSGDLISSVYKVGAELGLAWRNYGFVGNYVYQYDTEIMDDDAIDFLGNKTHWTNAAEDYAGNAFDVLDTYVYGSFEVGENPLEVRVGKQVINWGEGLYFIDGVSTQVPLNFNKLVTPGAELKEAYIGVESIYAQQAVGDSSSVSAYVQTKWRRTEFAPRGTFYGDDAFFRGGTEVDPVFGVPMRGSDQEASDSGQWGISGRTTIGDAEFGLYYSRYHETLPFVTANTPGLSLTGLAQYWPEDLDMYGMSLSTTVGEWSVSGEVAYRPDRPLFMSLASPNAFTDADLTNAEKHDTVSASVNGIWLGGALPLGIDSQVVLAQFGADYIAGDLSDLQANANITKETLTPDSLAYGAAVEWIGTWQGAYPGTDISLGLFLQKDIKGNSHFWGNFAEDRLLGSLSLTANIGNEWEASAVYSWINMDNSHYDTQDVYNLSVNYKF